MACIFVAIVFTRLIIGEVMKTYNTIISKIDIHLLRERVWMIREAQTVLGRGLMNKDLYPKVIIVRQQEK